MAEVPEPDIFIRILNKVDKIDGIAADVRDIKLKLVEHDRRFDQMDQRFDRVDQTLAKHTVRLDQLDQAVIEIHNDVKQHSVEIADLKTG